MWRQVSIVVTAAILAAPAVSAGDQIEKGQEVYAAQKCSVCHSIAGKGNAKGSLDGVGSKLTAAEIKQWLVDPAGMTEKTKAQRKPPMKVKSLSAQEVDALVAYLSSLKK